jgi:hypothetical protein
MTPPAARMGAPERAAPRSMSHRLASAAGTLPATVGAWSPR